jgi:hypothetical protein
MNGIWKTLLPLGLICLVMTACSDPRPKFKKTYPITGRILVDGQPAEGVQVILRATKVDPAEPLVPAGTTDGSGKFAIASYLPGDGAAEGEYKMTATWKRLVMGRPSGKDKLGDRYSKPESAPKTITVTNGPVDLGDIQLTTK